MTFVHDLMFLVLEAAPYLLLGFALAGLLHQFLPARFVQKHLGGDSWKNIFKASVIGTPVPLCSCGVVPVGLGLYKDGASKATAVSFLISTPENGVESISLTYSFFGLPFTVIRIVFAILVANITALGVAWFGGKSPVPRTATSAPCCSPKPQPAVPQSCCSPKPQPAQLQSCCSTTSPTADSQSCCSKESKPDGFNFVVREFVPVLAGWIILGFLISAAITSLLPGDLLGRIDPRWAVPLAGLVGVPMYVCASASTPIAFGLFSHGLSPGACLVFLLTGPATNSANVPLYLRVFGARTTGIYYGGIYAVSVALGLLIDSVAPLSIFSASGLVHHHFQASPLHYLSGVLLAVLLGSGIWRRVREGSKCASGDQGSESVGGCCGAQ